MSICYSYFKLFILRLTFFFKYIPNIKWPAYQRGASLIHNGTLETLIWSRILKITSLFSLKIFNSDNFSITSEARNMQVAFAEIKFLKTWTWISDLYLIRQLWIGDNILSMEGHLNTTFTVPLKYKNNLFSIKRFFLFQYKDRLSLCPTCFICYFYLFWFINLNNKLKQTS